MDSNLISSIKIQCLVHSTESLEKVKEAIKNLVFEEPGHSLKIKCEKVQGHYKNPIIILRSNIKNPTLVDAFAKNISSKLPLEDKKYLSSNLNSHLDGEKLYLRFNKQSAFLGRIEFGSSDPIKVQVKLKLNGRSPAEACKELGWIT